MEIRIATTPEDLKFCHYVCRWRHYLGTAVPPIARPMFYILEHNNVPLGVFGFSIPQATHCGNWWGKNAAITKWQVVDMSRVWVSPLIQAGGYWARPDMVPGRWVDGRYQPNTVTWAIGKIFKRIQKDWVAYWPPVELAKPYHVLLIISYHDPAYHNGSIYRALNALPMYTHPSTGKPRQSSSKLYGYCWKLKRPTWDWWNLDNLRPRNMRLPFGSLGKPLNKKRVRRPRGAERLGEGTAVASTPSPDLTKNGQRRLFV